MCAIEGATIGPLIGGLIRPCGNEELEMSNQQLSFSAEQGTQGCGFSTSVSGEAQHIGK